MCFKYILCTRTDILYFVRIGVARMLCHTTWTQQLEGLEHQTICKALGCYSDHINVYEEVSTE